MASRAMHLAIAKKMNENHMITNFTRFELGQVLPDAISPGMVNHADSHFKATVCDGRKKMIDFAGFRAYFEQEIVSDNLYLGYYFHLIQDAIYRKFLYYDCGYQVTCREDVETLYNDFRLLNTYLVSKYQLENHMVIPDGFQKEKINCVYPFSVDEYLEDMKNDFLPYQNGETKFFTEKLADEYITKCSEICSRELVKVKAGQTCINPMDYAWDLPVRS